MVVKYFDAFLNMIPLSFVLGFYVSYVASKFSSAVLPPECFAKLDAGQVTKFEAYFEGVDAELREKVAPKVDKRGASYVVKTFSLTEDGAPKRIDSLPYEPVEASVAVDYWSLGALLFQLVVGEPLVSSNRDDDCVDGNAMAAAAYWRRRGVQTAVFSSTSFVKWLRISRAERLLVL